MPNGKKSSAQEKHSHKIEHASYRRLSTGAQERSLTDPSARATRELALLGQMTEGIAHDFRNILTVIDSSLRLAENSSNAPRTACTFISGAREGVARGLALTSQLLNFGKQRDFQACAADANELLKTLVTFLRYGAGSEVRILLELSPNIPNCLIDPSEFDAAILNLVINARDAMPRGGEIQISTALSVIQNDDADVAPSSYVRVRVKDNGSGMTDAVLEKIFEPFFTTKGEHGTGLGVPQVDAFIRYLGGHICVVSDVGQGTTFDLFFPAAQQSGARTRPTEISATPPMPSVKKLSAFIEREIAMF
jgi:signal transduction histidine kinase